MKTYIGIDIGLKGAIVVQSDKIPTGYDCFKMPIIGNQIDIDSLYAILKVYKDTDVHVIFEKLGVIFGSSKATAFSMGYQLGILEAICVSLNLRYSMVSAKVWQKVMFEGVSEIKKSGKTSRDTKGMALIAAKRLFPKIPLSFKEGLKPHDGLVDALLISEYGKRNF